MNLSTLRYYRSIVDARSISKVAQSENISQSALSQIIQKLEDEIGHQLLIRSNKGVQPTDIGHTVYDYAVTFTRMEEKMYEEIRSSQSQVSTVRLSGYSSFMNYSLPCVIHKLRSQFPNLRFELFNMSQEESVNDLIRGLTDLCFVRNQPQDSRILAKFIGKEKVVLVAPNKRNYPSSMPLQKLAHFNLVLLDASYGIQAIMEKLLKSVDMTMEDLNILFEADTISGVKTAIASNGALGILPYMSVKKELYDKEFKEITIDGFDPGYDIYLAARRDDHQIGMLSPLIDFFQTTASSDFC